MADEQPIIIIKKKGGHGGHHGGAWKVAYADFVTAMMALFIVLWLMNTSKPVQHAVSGYFRDPKGTAEKKGTGLGGEGQTAIPIAKKQDLAKLKEDLMKAMESLPNYDKLKNQIEMTITPEGLKIEMLEDPQGTFFENGKAQPTPALQGLLQVLSVEIGKLPNSLLIEGHTDSRPFSDLPELRQLGVVDRPRKYVPATDAEQRRAAGSGCAGAWLRRSESAQAAPTAGRFQPQDHFDYSKHRQTRAATRIHQQWLLATAYGAERRTRAARESTSGNC